MEYSKISFTDPLLSTICVGSRSERISANENLARYFYEKQDYIQAKVFIYRAWILSEFSNEILPLFIKIHEALKEFLSIREAYKRIGIRFASEGNILAAMKYFNLCQYTLARYEKIDKYALDFDVLDAIHRLAKSFRLETKERNKHKTKIRIAHFIYSQATALHKIDYAIAEFFDRSRFEILFVFPDRLTEIGYHKTIISNLKKFDCSYIAADKGNALDQALTIANTVNEFSPDIIYTSASMADFWTYFITLLFPRSVKIGSLMGPPPLFISHMHDYAITAGNHLLIDCLVDCALVGLELPLPTVRENKLDRSSFGIPEDAIVLISGGRATKFQDQSYWAAISAILNQVPNVYFIVIGPAREEIPFIDQVVEPSIEGRLKFLTFREDYLDVFSISDIGLDTFPQSGGIMIIETMALGLPIVTFQNDYSKLYEQTNMSLADEYCGISELIVPRDNFDDFKKILLNLIENTSYRMTLAMRCKEQAYRYHGNPQYMVKKIEDTFLQSINSAERSLIDNDNQSENQLFMNLSIAKMTFHLGKAVKYRLLKQVKNLWIFIRRQFLR